MEEELLVPKTEDDDIHSYACVCVCVCVCVKRHDDVHGVSYEILSHLTMEQWRANGISVVIFALFLFPTKDSNSSDYTNRPKFQVCPMFIYSCHVLFILTYLSKR